MAIKHPFVQMLENRSFHHMLGFADLQGSDAQTGGPTHADHFLKPTGQFFITLRDNLPVMRLPVEVCRFLGARRVWCSNCEW
jgi:hypothetical protein